MRPFLEQRPLLSVALRDLQSSYGRFAFVIASMALGIAALVGVRGSAESVRRQFLQDTRALLAADVVVQSPTYPNEEQRAAVAQLSSGRVTSTLVTETLAMASSEGGGRPQMADVTAVDPSQYPFYGHVVLRPQEPLPQLLDRNSIAVSQMLLTRLNARIGDTVRIAGQEFHVAAILVSQPDRLFNDNPVSLPVLMSSDAFARTGLIDNGGRLSTRYLFKVARGMSVDALRNNLARLFPGSQITDFHHGKPELSEAIDRATSGLSMICLFALVLACAGVAMTMRSHIRERLDAIATMKSLGATFGQVLGIYLLQILLLAVAGSLAGIALGFGLELLLLHFAQSFFSGPVAPSWTWQTFLEALTTGVLSTLLLTLPVLLDLRTIKPLLILRRDFEPDRGRRGLRTALFSAPIVLGLGLLALWLSNSRMIAEYFLVGLGAAILAFGLVAQLVLWAARSTSGTTGKVSFLSNYAIKSLFRPGNQTIAVLVALGISTGFTLGVFLIQRTILQELSERVPETLPSIILAGVTRYETPGLSELLQRRPEVIAPPEFIPMAQVRLIEVDGKPADQLFTVRSERRFLQPRPAAGVDAPPSGAIITQGSWWDTQSPAATTVAIREDVAQHLHLSPGSRVTFQLGTKLLPVTVAAVYRWQQRSLASSFDFILPLQSLADVPVLYVGGIHLRPGTADSIQSLVYQKFPSVTIFNLSDILGAFETITNEMTLIVKSLAAFVIAAGIGVLAASVAGDRMERFREVVFLKSIGATRRQIAIMSSIEFLLLGLFAGTIGAVFASSFAALLARRLFHFTLHTEWLLIVTALLATALLAITVGWLASYRVLRLRPNEALR